MIENPNSSGQGYDPDHINNPYDHIIRDYGWSYSHSTLIRRRDGSTYSQHCYRYPETDWVIGISQNEDGKQIAVCHRLGSGHASRYGVDTIGPYLKRKTSQLRQNRI